MRGTAVGLLLIIAVIGGVALWVRRSRPELSATSAEGTGAPRPQRRVSLLTEAIGYIGTILVLAGAASAVGQNWDEFSTAGRLAILGVATLVFLGIGLVVRGSAEPAFGRLAGVTWAVSVAGLAGFLGVVNAEADTAGETAFLVIAGSATAYAAALWFAHRHAIQQAVLFAGVLLTTAAVVVFSVHSPDAWMVAVPLWAVGCGWAAAGWWRRLPPWYVAVPLGLLAALIAPTGIDTPSGLRFGIGIGTATAVMALGVLGRFTPGLAMASIALLGYVIGAVTYYFGDTLGVPASLSIAGLVILALAAVATRWHWFSRKHPPAELPPSSGGEPPGEGGSGTGAPERGHHRAA